MIISTGEEYDMKTSSASGAPRRRRQAASTKPTRSPQASSSSYRESTVKGAEIKPTSRVEKKPKKAAYSETDSIQETLTAYILCCYFCGSCNCIRYGNRNVCRSIT